MQEAHEPGLGSATRLFAEVERLVGSVETRVGEVAKAPRPSAGSLHRLHQDLRRLRLGLSLGSTFLAARSRDRLAPLNGRVQRLAQLVGQVRDRDVAVELLAGVEREARAGPEKERLDRYRGRLRDDAHTGRELLRARLRAEANAGLFEEIRSVLGASVRRPAAGHVRTLLDGQRGQLHRKLLRAHRKARRRPSMDRLHRLRIRVRRFRQLAELSSTVDPVGDRPLPGILRRLQRELGHLHDLDMLLAGLDPDLRESRWARALGRERRSVRRAVVTTLESLRPRKVLRAERSADR